MSKIISKWTEDEINWLIENYAGLGKAECAKRLNKTLSQVNSRARKLNLFVLKEIRSRLCSIAKLEWAKTKQYKVNPEQFYKVTTAEAAYILGLTWADGTVYKSHRINKISVEMVEKDLSQLIPVFNRLGTWNMNLRERINRQKQLCIHTSNKPLVDFLIENDYKAKSSASADKILSIIPDNLKHYFFRGISDGDGCFYLGKPNSKYAYSVSSSYDQDWNYFEKICDEQGIKYSISHEIRPPKNGKVYRASSFKIYGQENIRKIGEFLYKDFLQDGIGLTRKFDKYQQILERFSNRNAPKPIGFSCDGSTTTLVLN